MYTIEEISITDFWNRTDVICKFNSDVNIIIGKNGTGKTTFMNIVHAVLSVDLDGIIEHDFRAVKIKLADGSKKKTVQLTKVESDLPPFQFIQYQISNKKYELKAFSSVDRVPPSYKRRVLKEAELVKSEISDLVSLSSLSVYRLRNSDEFEIKDRAGKRLLSPVDFRLVQLKNELTQFQFELSQEINTISTALQKEVLASILYSGANNNEITIPESFNKRREKSRLIKAYRRLNVLDDTIRDNIVLHIEAIDSCISKLHNKEELDNKDLGALQSYVRAEKIIEMSLSAEAEIAKINEPISDFLAVISSFITDKDFFFDSGALTAVNEGFDEITTDKLSSGEKQLLILLIETLLQKKENCIYLTDEPELSLHIEWQRNILPSIKKLNPNAQIIAATHSPEVASKYKNNIINMKEVIVNE